jgi:hypothetical protein
MLCASKVVTALLSFLGRSKGEVGLFTYYLFMAPPYIYLWMIWWRSNDLAGHA